MSTQVSEIPCAVDDSFNADSLATHTEENEVAAMGRHPRTRKEFLMGGKGFRCRKNFLAAYFDLSNKREGALRISRAM